LQCSWSLLIHIIDIELANNALELRMWKITETV
jgi:hypothetical protein